MISLTVVLFLRFCVSPFVQANGSIDEIITVVSAAINTQVQTIHGESEEKELHHTIDRNIMNKIASSNKRALQIGIDDDGSESGCSLCYDETPPSNLATEISTNFTCLDAVDYLQNNVNSSDPLCRDLQHNYYELCGCPKPQLNCAGVCVDGSAPTLADRIIPYDFNQNGKLDQTCKIMDSFVKELQVESDVCSKVNMASNYCGCKDAASIFCTPCYGNDIMPNYTRDTDANETCGNIASSSIFLQSGSGSGECRSLQVMGSELCGCPRSPPEVKFCSPCYGGEQMPNFSKQISSSVTSGATCGQFAKNILKFGDISAESCEIFQYYAAVLCDCSRLPPRYDNGCKLCSADKTLQETASVEVNGTMFSCSSLQNFVNMDKQCSLTKTVETHILTTCCAKEGSGGKGSSSGAIKSLFSIIIGLFVTVTTIIIYL